METPSASDGRRAIGIGLRRVRDDYMPVLFLGLWLRQVYHVAAAVLRVDAFRTVWGRRWEDGEAWGRIAPSVRRSTSAVRSFGELRRTPKAELLEAGESGRL